MFILRFLDGTCLKVAVDRLPKKFQIKSAKWEEATLKKDAETMFVPTSGKRLEIHAHILYTAGRII